MEISVAVQGGVLHGSRWGGAPPSVLGLHGVTGNHRHLAALGTRLAARGLGLVAVDLRGRGRSASVEGPAGLAAHAEHQVAVLDQLGVERAVVVGHSMGGFVATVLAHRHPDRVAALVLVDGGLPLADEPLPPGTDPEAVVRQLLGPALARLSQTFASREAYLDLWRAHPAFAGWWSDELVDAMAYDLVGDPPTLRSSVREAAVLADAADQLAGDDTGRAVAALAHPTRFLAAPRGLLDQVPPLYPSDRLDRWRTRLPGLVAEVVPDVNHYSILLADRGAGVVAAAVEEAAEAGRTGA